MFGLAGFVGEAAVHGFGILSSQLKNVSHLDASLFDEMSLGIVNTGFTGSGLAQVKAFGCSTEIGPRGIEAVLIGLICPTDHAIHGCGCAVGATQKLFRPTAC